MNKTAILLLAVILLAGAVIGTTVAYLTTNTSAIVNTFEYAKVSCDVEETFKNDEKSNVQIRNTGNIPAYIRAYVVVNWLDSAGNIVPSVPSGYDYDLKMPIDSRWVLKDEGYYYYSNPVAPDDFFGGCLYYRIKVGSGTTQYRLSVEIIATAIQSQPANVITDVWHVTLN